ncbi:unnamed protein product [Calypogeia fissa]
MLSEAPSDAIRARLLSKLLSCASTGSSTWFPASPLMGPLQDELLHLYHIPLGAGWASTSGPSRATRPLVFVDTL